jgi:hypothetical protein
VFGPAVRAPAHQLRLLLGHRGPEDHVRRTGVPRHPSACRRARPRSWATPSASSRAARLNGGLGSKPLTATANDAIDTGSAKTVAVFTPDFARSSQIVIATIATPSPIATQPGRRTAQNSPFIPTLRRLMTTAALPFQAHFRQPSRPHSASLASVDQ